MTHRKRRGDSTIRRGDGLAGSAGYRYYPIGAFRRILGVAQILARVVQSDLQLALRVGGFQLSDFTRRHFRRQRVVRLLASHRFRCAMAQPREKEPGRQLNNYQIDRDRPLQLHIGLFQRRE
jgi:hypothetical protein